MKLALLYEADSRWDLFRRLFGSKKPVEKPAEEPTEEPESQSSMFDMDRRGFIRAAGSAAASAASGISPVFGLAAKVHAVKSIYDSMPDSELLATPEDQWLDKIDPARRRQIVRDNPEHGKYEAGEKMYKILTYGLMVGAGVPKSYAKTANNAAHSLAKIARSWNVKQSDIMDNMVRFMDSGSSMANNIDKLNKVNQFLRQNGQKLGIKLDLGNKPHEVETEEFWHKLENNAMQQRQERARKRQEREDAERQEREDAEAISRWEGEGGSFESKLKKALALI